MQVRTIAAQVHGRYLVREGPPERLLIGFHGYAQSAEMHMADLEPIPGVDAWTVISVQALNRFYLSRTGETVASWMTSQDRERAIADNINYVQSVVAGFAEARTIVVEGFSQGAAMAYRAAATLDHVAGVLILGGDLPPDVTAPLPKVLIGRGEDDDWYTDEKFRNDLKFFADRAEVATCVFRGKHEWSDEFRRAAGDFLRALTRQHVDQSAD